MNEAVPTRIPERLKGDVDYGLKAKMRRRCKGPWLLINAELLHVFLHDKIVRKQTSSKHNKSYPSHLLLFIRGILKNKENLIFINTAFRNGPVVCILDFKVEGFELGPSVQPVARPVGLGGVDTLPTTQQQCQSVSVLRSTRPLSVYTAGHDRQQAARELGKGSRRHIATPI